MIAIRKATKNDAGLIRSLALQVFPATYRQILSPEQIAYMLEWMYAEDCIRKQTDEGHVYFVAAKDGETCGYASVQQEKPDLFHLHKIYVLPLFQGFKIGQYLFNEIIDHIKVHHPAPCIMELHVNRLNRAIGFYKRMGMNIVREGDFAIGNGYYMNDYIMALHICSFF
jgi:ribosomal protein S18 acetylase RimI-like enzyme